LDSKKKPDESLACIHIDRIVRKRSKFCEYAPPLIKTCAQKCAGKMAATTKAPFRKNPENNREFFTT
jgi:hypothetical protein